MSETTCGETPSVTATLAERVGRGARLLDEKRPGWAVEIDVGRLCLSSSVDDLLGQLFGKFDTGADELGLGDSPSGYGFDLNGHHARQGETYGDLNVLWRAEIAKRLEDAEARKVSVSNT